MCSNLIKMLQRRICCGKNRGRKVSYNLNSDVNGRVKMPLDNGVLNAKEFRTTEYGQTLPEESLVGVEKNENIQVLEGEDFTKYVDVEYNTREDALKRATAAKAKERSIDYRYIDQMKQHGVTEDLAIKAFVGRFGGNEDRTQFFLNSKFYYGSDAPTPLDRLRKAVNEDTIPECIELLEGTKIALDQGDHF